MHVPGPLPLLFVFYAAIVLPFAAVRSAQRLRAAGDRVTIAAQTIWISTLVSLGVLLLFAWAAGRSYGEPLLAIRPLTIRDVLAAAAALAICFVLRAIAHAIRSAEERRNLFVYQIVPRRPREWGLWAFTVLVASVAEEAAYRGVLMSILWYALGNPWLAGGLCALAFAVAHSTQGAKSAAIIFAVAVTMHVLVIVTRSLLPAILVHALFDFASGWMIRREADRLGIGAPAGEPPLRT
jgi:membrane protease YdiL (CAAX protease family)